MTQPCTTHRAHPATLTAGLLAAVLIAATAAAPAQAAGTVLSTQTLAVDGVEVTAKGTIIGSRAQFSIELNTHMGDLTNDLSKSRLIAAGAKYTNGQWSGDPAGGHHRSGRITFFGRGKSVGVIALRLSGWLKPVTFRWDSKGQPLR